MISTTCPFSMHVALSREDLISSSDFKAFLQTKLMFVF